MTPAGHEEVARRRALVESVIDFCRSRAWGAVRAAGLAGDPDAYAECEAEMFLGAAEAAARFDPARGVAFTSYCGWWLLRARNEWVRFRRWRGVRGPTNAPDTPPPTFLRFVHYEPGGEGEHTLAVDVAPGDAAPPPDFEDWRATLGKLPSGNEREVLRLIYVEGRIPAEAARALGVSKTRVGQLRDSALRRLRASRVDSTGDW